MRARRPAPLRHGLPARPALPYDRPVAGSPQPTCRKHYATRALASPLPDTAPPPAASTVPFHVTDPSPLVRSPPATLSHSFFFSTAFGDAGGGAVEASSACSHTRVPTSAPSGGSTGTTCRGGCVGEGVTGAWVVRGV
eukprot:261993-Chlamydomonas_euryale.AAC.5